MNEPGTYKILEEWKHFYPVEAALKNPLYDTTLPTGPHSSPHPVQQHQPPLSPSVSSSTGIPPVLEVIVGGIGGVRMRYPSCYVLCTDMDEPPKLLETAYPTVQPAKSADSESASCPTGAQPAKPQGSVVPPQEVIIFSSLLFL